MKSLYHIILRFSTGNMPDPIDFANTCNLFEILSSNNYNGPILSQI